MRAAKRIRLVPALALLAACEEDGTGICPAVVVPALEVTVVDDGSGANVSDAARGWWISGEQSRSLEGSPLGGPLLAYGPAGRYALIVQHAGYQTWGRDDIRVVPGECGPQTVQVIARLVPAGGVPASFSPTD
jgi:hypothetical protein